MMDFLSDSKVRIKRVAVPGEAWLELKGTILVFHARNWISLSSMFIPLEWVETTEGYRRDFRRLWVGIIGVLVAILLSLPLSLLSLYLPERRALDVLLAVILGVLLAISVCVAAWALATFFRRRRYTAFTVKGKLGGYTIAFWHTLGEDAALDTLVEGVCALEGDLDETIPYPIRMKHIWRRPRPVRIALLRGMVVSFFLYLLILSCDVLHRIGKISWFSSSYFFFLLAPPAFYVTMVLLRRALMLRQPQAYRAAVRSCARGALADARDALKGLLDIRPEYAAGRLLMVQVCAEQYAFDDAFYHCERLAQEHPALATELQQNLWGIKRMYERMQG